MNTNEIMPEFDLHTPQYQISKHKNQTRAGYYC